MFYRRKIFEGILLNRRWRCGLFQQTGLVPVRAENKKNSFNILFVLEIFRWLHRYLPKCC